MNGKLGHRVVMSAALAVALLLGLAAPGHPAGRDVYGALPLGFEANAGQTDPRVKFLARGAGYGLFLTSTEAVLVLAGGTSTVVRMQLVGASAEPVVEGVHELPGKSHYFRGGDRRAWRTDVPTYLKVQYAGVYPGVDLVYYGNQRRLEYDFVVAPGADPGAIALAFAGADRIEIDAGGDLILHTAGGRIRQHKPVIYQDVAGVRTPVAGGYRLCADAATVGFEVGAYDRSQPLVIDPVLAYSTYLGGTNNDTGFAIAVDAAGHAYVTGSTGSVDFPTTAGAFDPAFNGGSDAFVTKLDPAGSAVVYSTYLGGSGIDQGRGIAVDAAGHAYVTGSTGSANFPTTAGAFDPTFNGALDAFVAKLDATGSALVYSTYLGGSNSSVGNGIAVDAAGHAYVVGRTTAADFPTTAGAFAPSFGGGADAFVTKLDPAGTALAYSTYLGGISFDSGQGIAVDGAGHAYVTGLSISADFPVTVGAFDPSFNGVVDAFVTRLDAAGATLVYSTYLGGSAGDSGIGIAVDPAGNAYVTGSTGSADFPTTAGAFDPWFNGVADAFVTKLDPAGAVLLYSTYLGGSGGDAANAIAVDSAGNAYVAGQTLSADFPTTAAALQAAFGGLTDAFVTKVDPAGATLAYSTYLGGSGGDTAFGIAVDPAGNAYATGNTTSANFPTTAGAFAGAFNGVLDAFVTKIAFTVPFAAFDAKVELEPDEGEFEVKAAFSLGAGSDGIEPLSDDVTLKLGGFSLTVPAGAFTFHPAKSGKGHGQGTRARWTFEGVIDGVALEAKLTDLGAGRFELNAEGDGADLAAIADPITVTLTIGDDTGMTTVDAELDD